MSSHHRKSIGHCHLAPRICASLFVTYYKKQNSRDLKDGNKMVQLHWEPEKLLLHNNLSQPRSEPAIYREKDLEQGCTNPGCQITQATKFCIVLPNICQPSTQQLLLVTLPVPRILRWSPDFWKISAILLYNFTAKPACSVVLI
jgi:hypothetical protein